jgi:hypothetical protein
MHAATVLGLCAFSSSLRGLGLVVKAAFSRPTHQRVSRKERAGQAASRWALRQGIGKNGEI